MKPFYFPPNTVACLAVVSAPGHVLYNKEVIVTSLSRDRRVAVVKLHKGNGEVSKGSGEVLTYHLRRK